ncbi:MAG: HAD family hydrolase, partial [Myxococcales bacterium]|nr:HAD family hydrolase [Myxococcales bacterium]
DRFGYIRAAAHGTRMLPFTELREKYGRTFIDLRDPRWVFLSTLFDISLACLYGQTVDLLDDGRLEGPKGYLELYRLVRSGLDAAHVEGRLKDEIIKDPSAYVDLDEDVPKALLDQKLAGKKLMLITNSEWHYTHAMMSYAFDPFLPEGTRWRDLFDIVIVQARKPAFFVDVSTPLFEVINDEGHLRPVVGPPRAGGTYLGGHARLVETALGLADLDVLYVGDHIFSDVNVSKSSVRWRTALILRELEAEIEAMDAFAASERELSALMADKAVIEVDVAQLRLDLQRQRAGLRPVTEGRRSAEIEHEIEQKKAVLRSFDERISPLAEQYSRLHNPRWGPVMRAGIDKSHMARQVERYADVYTSRVGNFLYATPNVYLRSPKSSLPHDG